MKRGSLQQAIKRLRKGSKPKPAASERNYVTPYWLRRSKRAAMDRRSKQKRLTVSAVGTVGLLASILGVADAWLQTYPTVSAPAVNKSYDDLPFQFTNPSRIFWMYEVTPICRVSARIASLNNLTVHVEQRHAATEFDVAPQGPGIIICDAAQLFDQSGELHEASGVTITIVIRFRTRFWPWERESEPFAWGWGTAPNAGHFWWPVKVPDFPIFPKTADVPKK